MCCTRLAANAGPKRVAKNRHLGSIARLWRAISSQLRHVSTIRKNLLSSYISSTCPHNMVNFGPLAAEIVSLVWGTPGNFNGCRVLAAWLHGTLVVGISQTLWRWTEDTIYIRQGGHHVGHWPTFLVSHCFYLLPNFMIEYPRTFYFALYKCALYDYLLLLRLLRVALRWELLFVDDLVVVA